MERVSREMLTGHPLHRFVLLVVLLSHDGPIDHRIILLEVWHLWVGPKDNRLCVLKRTSLGKPCSQYRTLGSQSFSFTHLFSASQLWYCFVTHIWPVWLLFRNNLPPNFDPQTFRKEAKATTKLVEEDQLGLIGIWVQIYESFVLLWLIIGLDLAA